MLKKLSEIEQKCVEYAEKYGIIEFKVQENSMLYYVTYPNEGTYKVLVYFGNEQKEIRKHLKNRRNNPKYNNFY